MVDVAAVQVRQAVNHPTADGDEVLQWVVALRPCPRDEMLQVLPHVFHDYEAKLVVLLDFLQERNGHPILKPFGQCKAKP